MFETCVNVPEGDRQRHVSKKHLMTFLCKLRQGLSDEFLRVMFNYSTRQSTSQAVATVRKSLMLRFVPQNLGFGAITRELYIQRHVSAFANELYNPNPEAPKAIAYIDGTYCYIQKCKNFRVLRQSYCLHKGRHLLKPVLIVAPDGYILDIQGPYFSDAHNNDAQILRNEFGRDLAQIREWFEEEDVFIVDRGYRDAIPLLEQLGIAYKMPSLLRPNERQLQTEEANASRLVTKTRWIVEARNGHIKSKFKMFSDVIPMAHAVNIGDFYRIGGAIINKYHPLIQMADATVDLARSLLANADLVNVVQARVEAEHLDRRRGQWVPLQNYNDQRFPVLGLDYIRDLTVGVYQLGLAPSYVQDKIHREHNEVFEYDEHIEELG